MVFAFSKEAERNGRANLWLEAVAVLDRGLLELPKQQDLLRQRNVYRQNYGIDVHNRFSDAYNSGNVEKAKTLLLEGLKVIPESTLLQRDLSDLK